MPYADIKSLPAYVKKYSSKIQRQWRAVFNTVYKSTKGNEQRAFRAANSILKKRFTGKHAMEKNSRADYFNHLVDSWLGNLTG